MGFRFRRSIGILPGVRINLGRKSASVSLGVRGAHVTVGSTGVRNTVGIPGTGMSYTTHKSWGATTEHEASEPQSVSSSPPSESGSISLGWIVAAVLFVALIVVLATR